MVLDFWYMCKGYRIVDGMIKWVENRKDEMNRGISGTPDDRHDAQPAR
jgi:hypothetical protein